MHSEPLPHGELDLWQLLGVLRWPRRVELLAALTRGRRNVTDLVAAVGIAQDVASRQLVRMHEWGLLDCEYRGSWHIYELRPCVRGRWANGQLYLDIRVRDGSVVSFALSAEFTKNIDWETQQAEHQAKLEHGTNHNGSQVPNGAPPAQPAPPPGPREHQVPTANTPPATPPKPKAVRKTSPAQAGTSAGNMDRKVEPAIPPIIEVKNPARAQLPKPGPGANGRGTPKAPPATNPSAAGRARKGNTRPGSHPPTGP